MARLRILTAGACLTASLALAACGGVPATDSSGPESTAQDAAATPATPLAARAVERPEPARRALVPVAELRGMTSEQVSQLLGTPQFQRDEAPVEFWQYRGDGCVLHVFLYRTRDGLRVQYAEVRSRVMAAGAANRPLAGVPAEECLAKLAAARPNAAS